MKFAALFVVLLPVVTVAQEPAETRLKALEERLDRLEGRGPVAAQRAAKVPARSGAGSFSAFNPSIGVALDAMMRQNDARANAEFLGAELHTGAAVDPFAKGWLIVNGNRGGVEVEEAAIRTTSLPWNLTLTGGRQFATFGRLAHFHDHELPLPERPLSLETMIGGETQADGLELQYLFPTPFYLTAIAGAFNKIGEENDRKDNQVERTWDEFTFLGRLATAVELGDDHVLEVGGSSAYTPKRTMAEDVTASGSALPPVTTRRDTWRTLHGADVVYRYQPAAGGLYRGALVGFEWMRNEERRFDSSTKLPTGRFKSEGAFAYAETKLGRLFRPGVAFDYSEDLDNPSLINRTWTGYVSANVTEFNRVRLAYSHRKDTDPATRSNNIVSLQWTAILGYHVHGFRDR